jgi:RND family efflux transporter MFP subunit
MKKLIAIALICLAVGLGAGWLTFRGGSPNETGGRKILYYRDPMNPSITSPTLKKAPDGMDYVPVYAGEDSGQEGKKGIKIDPVAVQNIGVKTEEVGKRNLSKTIRTVGLVTVNETKVFSINTKIMGWVEKLYVNYTGMPVRKNEPLLELYSPELVTTQEEYLQALGYRMRLAESSLPESQRGAEQLVESARRRLLNWDITEDEIAELEKRGTPKKTLTFYSPVAGIVTDKMVNSGQNVEAGMELFKIADLSTVWVQADIYQYELPWVRVGQKATVELSYLPGVSAEGTISYIYPSLDAETKTAKVRIEIQNTPNIDYKPDMYATIRIASPLTYEVLAVPAQAIIHSGERNIAVISLGDGYFESRDVRLGITAGDYVEILEGLQQGDVIVTSSQFLIDSESNLKAALGAMSGQSQDTLAPAPQDTMPGSQEMEGMDHGDM